MARSRSRAQSSESREPNAIAMIRHRNAMRAEVRFRWSQEVIAGNKLIRGGMETEPCDNSSISFRQPPQKIAQRGCASRQTYPSGLREVFCSCDENARPTGGKSGHDINRS